MGQEEHLYQLPTIVSFLTVGFFHFARYRLQLRSVNLYIAFSTCMLSHCPRLEYHVSTGEILQRAKQRADCLRFLFENHAIKKYLNLSRSLPLLSATEGHDACKPLRRNIVKRPPKKSGIYNVVRR